MVLSIRKISYENDDLTGAGIWWFKNLNEADPYLILPLIATALNYLNLGVSNLFDLQIIFYSVELQKKTNIGLLIVSVHSSRSCNSFTCLSPTNGQQELSYIGLHQALSFSSKVL